MNFSQADDLAVEPIVASSIFYFESTEEVINVAGSGAFYTETFTFEAFSEAFIDDKILDGAFTYQLENTTSKPLDIEIEFLDASGNVLDSEQFSIAAETRSNHGNTSCLWSWWKKFGYIAEYDSNKGEWG